MKFCYIPALSVTIPVVFVMDGFSIASVMIFKGEVLSSFELGQRQELAMLLLKINSYGSLVGCPALRVGL